MKQKNPHEFNLGLLFYDIARKYPKKEAIVSENNDRISFKNLNSLSNQIAHYLLKKGLKVGDIVCLFNDKSFYGFASMIACLKIGVIYVNLDHESPTERLQKIIGRCTPRYILNCFNQQVETSVYNSPAIDILSDDFINEVSKENTHNLEITKSVAGNTPAYIMFTSGSTGFPKGATISHANLLNFIVWGKEQYNLMPDDRLTNINPIYFDNSVFDFYVSLFNGASLLPFASETVREPKMLVDKINQLKPTIWFSVPSMLIFLLTTKALQKKDFQSLRIITFGGEGFPKVKLKQLYDLYSNHIRFVNVYGPTECTCICSAYDINLHDFEDMAGIPTLGRLIPTFKYIILNNETYTKDNVGELCLMGPQVGLGYYNDLEHTAKSFVQNPLNTRYSEIMYKTGDIVELGEDDNLYFLGRKDSQIKHMGYRIELEEIEAAINSLLYVKESCVVYQKDSTGIGQIVAFVASSANDKQIIQETKKKLPLYMVPRQVVVVDALPKNRSGKIDRFELASKLI